MIELNIKFLKNNNISIVAITEEDQLEIDNITKEELIKFKNTIDFIIRIIDSGFSDDYNGIMFRSKI